MKAIISPSILSADLKNLGAQVRAAQEGGADEIHVDVMDGNFVPTITFGPEIVRACKDSCDLPIDVHLMIVEPEKHLKNFIAAGASTVTIHYETCPHIHRSLQTIREMGAKAGLTFNPGTAVDGLNYLTDVVDQVLLMSVHPGFGGQKFIRSALDKISLVRWILTRAILRQLSRWMVVFLPKRSWRFTRQAPGILWLVQLSSSTLKGLPRALLP
jgi:ribulose-phosphate 3-epimerase